jgi:hypothetical protein
MKTKQILSAILVIATATLANHVTQFRNVFSATSLTGREISERMVRSEMSSNIMMGEAVELIYGNETLGIGEGLDAKYLFRIIENFTGNELPEYITVRSQFGAIFEIGGDYVVSPVHLNNTLWDTHIIFGHSQFVCVDFLTQQDIQYLRDAAADEWNKSSVANAVVENVSLSPEFISTVDIAVEITVIDSWNEPFAPHIVDVEYVLNSILTGENHRDLLPETMRLNFEVEIGGTYLVLLEIIDDEFVLPAARDGAVISSVSASYKSFVDALTQNVFGDNVSPEIADALTILRHVINLPTEVEVTVATHDFDGNGVVEIADALLVLREIIGLNGNIDASYACGIDMLALTEEERAREESLKEELGKAIVGAIDANATQRSEQLNVTFIPFRPLRLSELTEFYVPNMKIDGYELHSVSILGAVLIYRYAPVNNDEWCHYSGIEVRIFRADSTMSPSPNATLEEVMAEVEDYSPRPNGEIRDGFLYLPGWNSIAGKLGDTRFDVTVPDSMSNYDFLLDLAKQFIDTVELVKVA